MHDIIVCTYDEKLQPHKHTSGAVCRDVRIADTISIAPKTLQTVSLGIKTYLPDGWGGHIYARSSLPVKYGLMLANSIAIIDADYRGERIAQFYNFTDKTISYDKYMRLAQIGFSPYYITGTQFGTAEIPDIGFIVDADVYDTFAEQYTSDRGDGKFGSTGHH